MALRKKIECPVTTCKYLDKETPRELTEEEGLVSQRMEVEQEVCCLHAPICTGHQLRTRNQHRCNKDRHVLVCLCNLHARARARKFSRGNMPMSSPSFQGQKVHARITSVHG